MSKKLIEGALLFYIVFLGLTFSEKLRLPALDKRKTLDECGRCKVLTDSFSHWVEKTSRGKFEGGDTAWEESKLKSYARSEVRLVEIQEGLCSELKKYQDYCYTLSEEVEQVIEKWWFKEDPSSVDIYTWLCIDTLKHCCPVNHFGGDCSPCPTANGQICNGNGKCDGEGTRQGNGTCNCKRGYAGKNCEECIENFYPTSDGQCQQCHHACNGCSGEGPSACDTCKPGWSLESGSCIDIDECLFESVCDSNEICINNEGSYRCKSCDKSCKTCSGVGAKNCTSCDPSNVLWGGMCITKTQHNDILFSMLKKLVVYTGLTMIAVYIHIRYFRSVLYIFFIILGVILYYLEPSQVHLLDVTKNLFFNSNLCSKMYDILGNIAKVFQGNNDVK